MLPHQEMAAMNVVYILVFITASPALAVQLNFTGDEDFNPQACSQYYSLPEDQRSIQYDWRDSRRQIIDYDTIITGPFYRFTSQIGGRMPDTYVPDFRCGNTMPVYLVDPHPNPQNLQHGQQVSVQVKATLTNITYWETVIDIVFCDKEAEDNFFVYGLVKPTFETMTYCAGDGEPCPEGTAWVNEQHRCHEDMFPVMPGDPVLSDPIILDNYTLPDIPGVLSEVYQFGFKCVIDYEAFTIDNGARFDVVVKLDGEERIFVQANSTHPYIVIEEGYLKDNLGKTVRCDVRSYWNAHVNRYGDYSSKVLQSNGYWAGIHRIDEEQRGVPTTLSELNLQTHIDFYLISTIPITCWGCKDLNEFLLPTYCSAPCKVSANIINDDFNHDICTLEIDEDSRQGNFSVSIKQIPGARREFRTFIEFSRMAYTILYDYTFARYQITSIPVLIQDPEKDAVCQFITDPHITTFDGVKYDAYTPGDYYAWIVEEYEIEVQVRFAKCGVSVACTCGIIVREGNDVLSAERCNSRHIRIHRLQEDIYTRDSILIRSINSGRDFRIEMPSGLIVETVWNPTWFMSAIIYGHSSLKNKSSSGLCGNFNGDRRDDLQIRGSDNEIDSGKRPKKFKESFRIKEDEPNFFIAPPTCRNLTHVKKRRCQCSNGQVQCPVFSRHAFTFRNDLPSMNTCDGTEIIEDEQNLGDSLPDPEDVFRRQVIDPGYGANLTSTWPTPSGITETQARNHCQQEIRRSPIHEFCEQSGPSETNEDSIEDCMGDIQVEDDLLAADGIASVAENMCLGVVQATRNVSQDDLVYNNETGSMMPPGFINISSQICPSLCFDQGDCIEGACRCYPGFSDSDCSVNITSPPQILGSLVSGLCDLTRRQCRQTRFYASNVLSNPSLSCRFSYTNNFAVDEVKDTISFPATMISRGEILCDIPLTDLHLLQPNDTLTVNLTEGSSFDSWAVSLTNDRILYSHGYSFIVFNSSCQECTDDATCSHKEGTCNINRWCYADGDIDPKDICNQCISSADQASWSTIEDNQPPVLIGNTTFYKAANEEFKEVLDIYDPDGHSFTCELVQGEGVNLTAFGYLVWFDDHNTDQEIIVKVTDQCGAYALFNISLRVFANTATTEATETTIEGRGLTTDFEYLTTSKRDKLTSASSTISATSTSSTTSTSSPTSSTSITSTSITSSTTSSFTSPTTSSGKQKTSTDYELRSTSLEVTLSSTAGVEQTSPATSEYPSTSLKVTLPSTTTGSESSTDSTDKSSGSEIWLYIGIGVLGALVIILAAILIVQCCRSQGKKKELVSKSYLQNPELGNTGCNGIANPEKPFGTSF